MELLTLPGYEDHAFVPAEWRSLRLDPHILEDGGAAEAVRWSSDKDKPFKSNVILNNGKKNRARLLLNFGGPVHYGFMAVGSNTTSASPTQTGPLTELTGNATRPVLFNAAGAAISDADFVVDPVGDFEYYIIVMGIFERIDGNNGALFAEYSIANQAAFGAGSKFYNRFKDGSPVTKDAAHAVGAQLKLRF